MGILDGQVAIVTGGGQGLGAAISTEFAHEGAAVALLDIQRDNVEAVAAQISAAGGRAKAYALDITDYDAYAAVVQDVIAWGGQIDVLVNNAAVALYGTILNDSLNDWRKTISVNLEAVYMGSKLVAPHMVERRSGRIISITSVQGFVSSGDCGAYNAAKGGIIAYTKSMAVELGQYGILVNAVAPGFMRTPMAFVNGVDETTTPDFQAWYIDKNKIPLRFAATPEDVAGTVVYLASRYCRYQTGTVVVVDGGLTATF
jgi:NAD(P)-dependent dehydrogenase (short-subunit alcohol dehydrogenase family)